MSGRADYIQDFADHPAPDMDRAGLMIVDMQYATGSRSGALARRMLAAPDGADTVAYRFDRIETLVVPNTQRLARAFRARGGRVVYVKIGAQRPDAADAPRHMRRMFVQLQNHAGSREHDVLDELAPEPGDMVVTKTTIGAFASTGLDALLRAGGIEQIYMTGVSTNMCVETTAREAADRGYAVTLVEDACASTHADLHEGTLANFRRLFGRVSTSEAALAELAGTPVPA